METILQHFAAVSDPEAEGHSVLEQYQAQFAAALRPAFDADTPPDVMAAGLRTCAGWLGSGVQRAAGEVRRTAQLLADKMALLSGPANPAFNESASTMLRLALLAAWADIFVATQTKALPVRLFTFYCDVV
jgi:hypothetical protein